MKVYMLSEADFDALLAALDRDPTHGYRGGSSASLNEAEKAAHASAHRFFNYQIRTWIDKVKS